MTPYTYAVGEFLTVESEFELFLFDTPPGPTVSGGDIVIRRGKNDTPTVERTGRGTVNRGPPTMDVEKERSTEPVRFMRLLLSAIQAMLLRQRATLAFGSAFRGPDGNGVGLFGPSNCGKSAASFRLALDRGYQLLADDLLVCHEGRVYPFPRYMNLPRDVPAVERWVRSEMASTEGVRLWADEVDVPRRLVTETVPEHVTLDNVLLAAPREPPGRSPEPVSPGRADETVAELRRSALAGWISESRTREAIDDGGADWRPIVQEVITDAACHRLEVPQTVLARSIAEFLEHG